MKFYIFIRSLFNPESIWEYGICKNQRARRNKLIGNVQCVLWKAGEQGHKKDYWVDFYSDWWDEFKPNSI